jgi:uncharacterized oxidoreductase
MNGGEGAYEKAAHSVVVAPSALLAYTRDILRGLGATRTDAQQAADHLVSSNLAGHDSHGVLLLPYYADLIRRGTILLDTDPEIVIDRQNVLVMDGRFGFGQVVGSVAAALAIERGRKHGIACVLGRNANHLGRLGAYTTAIADAGLVALLFVNYQGGDQNVAPFGGVERRLTNNPISMAAPSARGAVVLDMALSVVAEAKVWLARARGERLPEGWIADANGNASTDPDDFFAGGSLIPLGGKEAGHKGFALIVLVEILAGVLTGGGVCRADAPPVFSNGFFLVAIDVEPLLSVGCYAAEVETLREYVKSSRTLSDVDEIVFPGELEARSERQRRGDGIPIERVTWEALADLGKQVGVEFSGKTQ